jgi:hypothetical protein
MPIVNRLEEQYSSNIAFEYLNALDDGVGEFSFTQLSLRGHPAILIFDVEGEEILRVLSILEEDLIIEVLDGFGG